MTLVRISILLTVSIHGDSMQYVHLRPAHGADAALDELAGTLVLNVRTVQADLGSPTRHTKCIVQDSVTTYLRVADQLHGAALVGRKASDLTHNAANGLDALARDALLVDAPGGQHTAGGGVTTVNAPNDTCTMC